MVSITTIVRQVTREKEESQRAVIVGNRELSKAQRCDSPVVYSISIHYLVSIYKGQSLEHRKGGLGS